MKAWIAPEQGHLIHKAQMFHKGYMHREFTAKIRAFGNGVFWYEQARDRELTRDGTVRRDRITRVLELEVDVPIDDSLFSIDALKVPVGTEIQDRVIGARLVYGGPVHIPEDFVASVLNGSSAEAPAQVESAALPEQGQDDPSMTSPSGSVVASAPTSNRMIYLAAAFVACAIGVVAFAWSARRRKRMGIAPIVFLATSVAVGGMAAGAKGAGYGSPAIADGEVWLSQKSMCGPIAMYFACRSFGIDQFDVQTIGELAGATEVGVTVRLLGEACNELGLFSMATRLDTESLGAALRSDSRAIVLINEHFYYLDEVGKSGFRVTNFPFEPRWWPSDELAKQWDGVALLVSQRPFAQNYFATEAGSGTVSRLLTGAGVGMLLLCVYLVKRNRAGHVRQPGREVEEPSTSL